MLIPFALGLVKKPQSYIILGALVFLLIQTCNSWQKERALNKARIEIQNLAAEADKIKIESDSSFTRLSFVNEKLEKKNKKLNARILAQSRVILELGTVEITDTGVVSEDTSQIKIGPVRQDHVVVEGEVNRFPDDFGNFPYHLSIAQDPLEFTARLIVRDDKIAMNYKVYGDRAEVTHIFTEVPPSLFLKQTSDKGFFGKTLSSVFVAVGGSYGIGESSNQGYGKIGISVNPFEGGVKFGSPIDNWNPTGEGYAEVRFSLF